MKDSEELPSLEVFEQKLKAAKQAEAENAVAAPGLAMRLGAEFTAGVLVGTGMGLLLDKWLHTKPWLLIVCLCFGAAAGVRTMLATLKNTQGE